MTITAAPPQVGDADRLAALDGFGILDTPAEAGFDDAVHLACRLCAAPVALVSLVASDRQWFKARIGFPPCQTDLNSSVCAYALATPEQVLVISDLREDPRTATNPLVTGDPFLRFYAGAPLVTPEGHVLGTLCVIDHKPRPGGLTPEQSEDLRALARQVMDQLRSRLAVVDRDRLLAQQANELRRARRLDVLAKASAALLSAVDPAVTLGPILERAGEALGFDQAMFYDIALDGRHLRLAQAVGLSPEMRAQIARVPFGAHPCGMVAASRQPLLLTDLQGNADPTYDVPRALGLNSYAGYPIMSRGELCGVVAFASTRVPSFDGEALAFFETLTGLVAAVHERLDGEEALAEVGAYWRSLFERLSEGFLVGEVVRDDSGRVTDWRYVEVNHAWGDLVGIEARSVIGRTIREVFPGIEDVWVNEFADVVRTGEPATFTRQVGTTRRWYEGRSFRLGAERFGVLFLEVTARIEAERRRDALLTLGDRLRDVTDKGEIASAAATAVGEALGLSRAGYCSVDAGREIVAVDRDWHLPGLPSIAGEHRFRDYGSYIEELKRGETVIVNDVRTDPRTTADADSLAAVQCQALFNLPVMERGRFVGLLFALCAEPRVWTDEEVQFLREVADRTRAAVGRAEAEEQQRLLNGELSHRLKNSLALVQSMATQTLRDVTEREAVQAFNKRVLALSRAHDALVQRNWSRARLRAVMEGVLALQADLGCFHFDGPDMDVSANAAMSMSLLLHELATNALKYGALSAECGTVRVAWRSEDAAEPTLALDWAESGGPPATAPSGRTGFGSKLIRMGLLGTREADIRYESSGLRATFRAPLAQVRA